ncbi:hypothetical protein AVEN_154628-1 [Araneus ventricosus]|uniref:Helitron helicase-like domain-containing protein n=1 Tax=Araneus ventricosus TaxID=182803 RepID=A0A4Y2XF22_ARAVE|nr:hypothetical protein AVEN_154628-1 [Araneus ventricosus]
MSSKCTFCGALKFEAEASGLCCSNGKVSLPELPQLPEPLKSLMEGNHPKSKEFLTMIRKYNSSFQMTSFGTSLPMLDSTGFMPTFRIQGQVYHKAGSLMSLPNEEEKFLQIYFLGNEEAEAKRRSTLIPGTTKSLIESLQKMLHENNHYVQKFKMAIEDNPTEDLQIVIKADRKPIEGHERVFNTPALNEVAIIIAGNDFEKRDIVLTKRSNELKNICETHISYDALQYPLMFPRGEDGYTININQVEPGTSNQINKMVSAMSFYAYRLMVRSTENHLLNYRQLLHQYLVDMYAKIEAERLLFIRLNQKKLRVDEYIHLKDAITNDSDPANHGKLVILPSTFTGCPRNMHEYAQDAITYVRHGGKPSLFITYTFNPNCKEMTQNLTNGQSKTDRHDLVARLFRQKLIKFMNVLVKGQVFGSVKYWLYSIEWQKRGLPHSHILIWLTNTLKPNQIDDIISAEIPNPSTDKNLYDIVIKNMVHGPCGAFNSLSPCLKEGNCSKMYPRQFIKETQFATDGYPLYRRRKPEDGGQTATVKMKSDSVVIDNRWIVPYSPLLLKMFDAHINVECCNSIKSIKYILKYVHKGSDQGVFAAHSSNNCIDEISEYQAGRYISSNEAAWRIFGFPIHERYPTVIHLDMHLENGQRIYFSEDNLQCRLANPPNTTLTGFFELCKNDNFAKTLLYCNVPKFYTWDKSKKVFNRRKQGAIVEGHDDIRSVDALGRVYTVHSRNTDCYYLRLLLHKIKGPTSFKDLRTVNGIEYETYREACLALGLLENDNQWNEALKEAVYSDSPSKIRTLFALILSFCEPSSPKTLWENNKDCMSEDILNKLRAENRHFVLNYTDSIHNEALICR